MVDAGSTYPRTSLNAEQGLTAIGPLGLSLIGPKRSVISAACLMFFSCRPSWAWQTCALLQFSCLGSFMTNNGRINLFLDDERFPPNQGGPWHVVRSTEEAADYVSNNGVPDLISFDHDLGGEDTAIRFVNWLINRDLESPGFIGPNFRFVIHSQNPVGAKNLEHLLSRYLQFRLEESKLRPQQTGKK
ncbi:cyclic-phosphate processing receiver domain-containing protein [Comamonas testosteroni]|uniref:Cyclic-phosphate processing Receiver domain-containing protein n=1 Tax=Comamonas testosteroni TaxID=285 RepID=A0A8B4S6J8_COMTE|nr:cyclic-phosphate processing receiver domain-containing protein [Comamonas testosteroni]QQN68140.1 hypothetical protein IYN88_15185 [Comamonas testosteroni]SUY78631.1 Uncharacterised protein [Comamonas testosteroni]